MKVCWNLTNKCNKDCTYCFRELEENALSLEQNLSIMKKLYNAGVTHITFAGGEPLMYPNLEELLQYGRQIGMEMSLITNGSILRSITLDKYLPYLNRITFSVDSPSDYVNERIGRGKENYQHIKKLIPLIHEAYPELEIVVNSVITKETINEVDFMFEELSNELVFYGLKKWKISRFIPLRGHSILNRNYLDITDHDFDLIKSYFQQENAGFAIDVRDKDSFERKYIISPNGNIKKTIDGKENLILTNVDNQDEESVVRALGGRHV